MSSKSEAEKKGHNQLFYYEAPSVAVDYSYDATGELDVDRLIDQKPFWKITYPGTIIKPKKLIITDWSKKYNLNTSAMDWYSLFEAAKSAGVEIYVMTDELIRVADAQQLYASLPKINPLPYKDLLKEISKKNISRDEAEIVDYIKVQQLSAETLDKPVVDLRDFRKISIDEFSSILIPTFNPSTGFTLKVTLPEDFAFLKQILASNVPVIGLVLDCKYCKDQLSKFIKELKEDYSYRLSTVKRLSIWTDQQLSSLLELFPNVDDLTLEEAKIQSKLNPAMIVGLKSLELKNCEDLNGSISDLLNNAANLTTLKIRRSTLGELVGQDSKLEKLKNVDLNDCTIHQKNYFSKLIDRCPNVEEVNIKTSSMDTVVYENFSPLNTNQNLKAIKLSSHISHNQLNNFLSKFSNLEKIEISNSYGFGMDTSIEQLKPIENMMHVNEIIIKNDNINDVDLANFINQFPNINKLNISNCPNLNGAFLTNINLIKLNHLSISNSKIESGDLAKLLSQQRNLAHLEITDCGSFHCSDITLPALKSLRIENVANLRQTLKCFPNLQHLDIKDQKINWSQLKGHDLGHLTSLKLKNVDWLPGEIWITEEFNQFLKSARNLSYIDFSTETLEMLFSHGEKIDWKNIKIDIKGKRVRLNDKQMRVLLQNLVLGDELPLSDDKLDGSFIDDYQGILPIKKLQFRGVLSVINDDRLAKLILLSPNLSTLNISNCVEIEGTFIDQLSNDLPIQRLDISGVNIDLTRIRRLIAKCPRLVNIDVQQTKINLEELAQLIAEYPEIWFGLGMQLQSQLSKIGSASIFTSQADDVLRQRVTSQKNDKKEGETSAASPQEMEKFLSGLTDTTKNNDQAPPFKMKLTQEQKNQMVQNKSSKKVNFDANTSLTEDTLPTRQIFTYKKGDYPSPSLYRLKIHNKISIKDKIEFVDTPSDLEKVEIAFSDDARRIYNEKYKNMPDVYHGSLQLNLKGAEWYPLPSLSSQDKLINLQSDIPLEVAYCKRDQLYYVRPSILDSMHLRGTVAGVKANISFLIKSPKAEQKSLSKTLAKKAIDLFKNLSFNKNGELIKDNNYKSIMKLSLKDRINYLTEFCIFGVGELKLNQKLISDIERLNALIQQRVGACRHRSWVFMTLAQELGVEARAVTNDCHMFVEVFENKQWIKKDLGGYPSNLELINQAELSQADKVESSKVTPTQPSSLSQERNKDEATSKRQTGDQNNVAEKHSQSVLTSDNPFITWDTTKSKHTDFDKYLDEVISKTEILTPNQKNILILVEPDQMESFHYYVTEYFKKRNKESYYLDNFKNVSEKSAVIRDDNKLVKCDSSLVKFLKDANAEDALIANWSNYSSADVGYNSMIDENRKLKSTPIKPDSLVINILDKSKASRMGEDFYSRCRVISECPNLPLIHSDNVLHSDQDETAQDSYQEIEFFDTDWRKTLLGQIAINGQRFKIENARLIDAIDNKKSGVCLVNPPLHLPEFREYIAELRIKKKLEHNGQVYELADNFQITTVTREYNLAQYQLNPIITENVSQDDILINRETLHYLFSINKCENKEIYTTNGLIKNNKDKTLSLYITETLPTEQWSRILKTAQENKCLLEVRLKPGITIPGLDDTTFVKEEVTKPINQNLIISNDLEFSEATLLSTYPNALVVSVNQQTLYQDIIEGTELLNKDLDNLSFDAVQSDIWRRLHNKETIILKGQLSPQLARKLDSLLSDPPYQWINGEKKYCEGRLILLTDDKNVFTSSTPYEVQISSFDYWKRLDEEQEPEYKPLLEDFRTYCEKMQIAANITFSYGQLRDMFSKIKAGNYSNPFKPYFRLHPDVKSQMAKEIWKPKKPAKKIFESVAQKREDRLTKELEISPYIFIAGSSGVGKTTQILNRQSPDNKDVGSSVHVGFDNLQKWLEEGGLLFIDEANLEKEGTWDILEGVFNKTPCILFNKKLYPIKPHHKLVFTGNYDTFAGRHKHQFFEKHGQIFNFKEFPEKDLVKYIIEPALNRNIANLNSQDLKRFTHVFKHFYTFVNKVKTEHPLTPRNLKMMAMRLNIYLQEYRKVLPEYSLEQLASFATMDEIYGVVNDANQLFASTDLVEMYGHVKAKIAAQHKEKYNEYVVTDSRKHPLRIIKDQFRMRENQLSNKELKTFDLSGVLIEGSAGIGKSKMVIEYLKDMNFTEGSEDKENPNNQNIYYHITPTDPEKMQKILLKAFHEGAVVIIDELNSLPLERIMNQFSTGKDMNGNEPRNKGFFVIATQNPVSYAGRQVLSAALQNRFCKIDLGEYPRNELVEIAFQICDDKVTAERTVDMYLTAKNYAKIHHKYPEPTPRDLFAYLARFKKDKTMQAVEFVEEVAHKQEMEVYNEFIETLQLVEAFTYLEKVETAIEEKEIASIDDTKTIKPGSPINPIFEYLGDSSTNDDKCLTRSILNRILNNSSGANKKPYNPFQKLDMLIEAFEAILARTPSSSRPTSYVLVKSSVTDFFRRPDFECSSTQIKHISLLKEAFVQVLEEIPHPTRMNEPYLKEMLNPRNKNSKANHMIDFKQSMIRLGAIGLTNTRLTVNSLMGFDNNQDEINLKYLS